MNYVDKININGVTHEIRDTEARNAIDNLEKAISGTGGQRNPRC